MHVLGRGQGGTAIGKPRACVTVRVRRRELVIQAGSIGILKSDAMVSRLPPTIAVVSEEGEAVSPSPGSAFWITTETFDPFHAVCELPGSP